MEIRLNKKDGTEIDFFRELFWLTKSAELKADEWPEQMKDQMLSVQRRAFEQSVIDHFPKADDFVIQVGSEMAGRLQLNSDNYGLWIINISLLPAFQRKGIGTIVLSRLLKEADLSGRPIFLGVDIHNPAFSLYKRLGFEVRSQDELKYTMRYLPKAAVGDRDDSSVWT